MTQGNAWVTGKLQQHARGDQTRTGAMSTYVGGARGQKEPAQARFVARWASRLTARGISGSRIRTGWANPASGGETATRPRNKTVGGIVPSRSPIRSPDPPNPSPFRGGGLTVPWGIAVDGNDTVWVANFGFSVRHGQPAGDGRSGRRPIVSAIFAVSIHPNVRRPSSQCRRRPSRRISPATTSDALDRNTGVAIETNPVRQCLACQQLEG